MKWSFCLERAEQSQTRCDPLLKPCLRLPALGGGGTQWICSILLGQSKNPVRPYACFPHRSTSDYGPCSSQDPELSGPCQRPLCKGLPVLPWPSFSQGQSSKVIPSLGTPAEPKALLIAKQPTGSIEKAGWSQEQGTMCRFPCPSHALQTYFFFQKDSGLG